MDYLQEKNLKKIKIFLKKNHLNCLILSQKDIFLNESTSIKKDLLYNVINFSCSYGIVVICEKNKNLLFTDGRYLTQAKNELSKNDFDVFDISKNNISDFLFNLNFKKIGIVWDIFSANFIEALKKKIDNLEFFQHNDIIDLIKEEEREDKSILLHFDEIYSGESSENKIKRTQFSFKTDCLFISDSASINWLLNIRGNDLPNSPIFNSFAILEKNSNIVKVFSDKLIDFEHTDAEFFKLNNLKSIIQNYKSISVDKNSINAFLLDILLKNCNNVRFEENPILDLKAIKNEIEIRNFRLAHEIDGKIVNNLIKFIKENEGITEFEVSEKLLSLRKDNKNFFCESFNTIAGFNENGAIIHYRPNKKSSKKIQGDGVLLLDCGAHYKFGGTTDATRTIEIGNVDRKFPDFKKNYDLVLKSLLYLSDMHFPICTNGNQLDTICRQFLWQNGLDYQHGTGHGVGNFLSVHEYPPALTKGIAGRCEIKEGMILSIEPGVYFENKYGIRIENLVLVKKSDKYENFLMFETLTKIDY